MSDWRGGVTILSPDGSQREVLAREGGPPAPGGVPPVQPNGFAIDRDGSFLDTSLGTRLHNVSSLAFGGPDGRTAWLGCLLSDSLATFRSPVAGLPPSHWEWA